MSETTAAAKALQSLQPRLGTIQVRVSEGIKLDTVHNLIDSIAKLTGCPSCGFNGFDLQLLVDPIEFSAVRNLPNVNSVTFGNITRG